MTFELPALLACLDSERRVGVESGFLREETFAPDPRLVRHFPNLESGGSAHGFVSWSMLEASEFETAIAAEIARYGARRFSFEWKLFDHDQPTAERRQALATALEKHGFVAGDWEAALVAPAAALAAALERIPVPEGITFRRVTDPDALAPLDEIHAAVWGEATSAHWLPSRDLGAELRAAPGQLAIFLAEAAGEARPVSAAWVRFNPDSTFAGLWGGSTHPDYRRRGIYRTLLALRAREVVARGRDILYVDASPDSRPILESLGFSLLTGSRPYVWMPTAE